MTKYNGLVFPRGFTVNVEADSPEEAEEFIRKYVNENCVLQLKRLDFDDDWADNLLDEYEVCDIIERDW